MDAILYIHHLPLNEGITQRHAMLLKTLNSGARVIPLSFYDGRPRPMLAPNEQFFHFDTLIYEWFLREKPKFDRYFLIEWDLFCTAPLKEFYGAAYDRPCVGSIIARPWSRDILLEHDFAERDWHFFTHGNTPGLYPFLRGIIPSCGAMFSHECLEIMSLIWSENREVDRLICEVRMGTMACMAGFEPERIREDAHLFISPKDVTPKQSRGVWHRVKI